MRAPALSTRRVRAVLERGIVDWSAMLANRRGGPPRCVGSGSPRHPHFLFFGSSSGFAKEMLGVRSRVKQRSPGMSGSDCRTTAEMSVRLKQHTTPDGPRALWLLDGDVHAVNPPKLDPYERRQVAAKTLGRQ